MNHAVLIGHEGPMRRNDRHGRMSYSRATEVVIDCNIIISDQFAIKRKFLVIAGYGPSRPTISIQPSVLNPIQIKYCLHYEMVPHVKNPLITPQTSLPSLRIADDLHIGQRVTWDRQIARGETNVVHGERARGRCAGGINRYVEGSKDRGLPSLAVKLIAVGRTGWVDRDLGILRTALSPL